MKYELTSESKEVNGHTVYRIKALKTFWVLNVAT